MKVIKVFCLAVLAIGLISAMPGFAQSITSGDIAGVLTDPSGAVVPNAKVTATSDATGEAHNATTNGEGAYRFPFLKPGAYTLAASATGFQPATRKMSVTVGETANGSLVLAVIGANTTVEVSAPLTQIDNGDNSTSFSEQQITLVPNPGNDLSAIAQTAPGIIMNTQSGAGNFSSFGLPGTSNLFTLDGQNDNDPFLNLNNSGATNLLLGANEISEATVIQNGYSGQYGQLAGAQVNYVTKSGGNKFHGNAIYQWNGRAVNANDFINNQTGTPRPFDNVNQWATSIGGPIVKDKTFFFWDYEGLRVVLPTSNAAFIPTPQFATAALQNIGNVNPAGLPFFQKAFNLYANAPGAGRAVAQTPTAGDPCSTVEAAFPKLLAPGTPCVANFQSTAGNFTHEYLTALRIDHKFTENDSIWGRVQTDQGFQATTTDPISPLFNAASNQPEYQGQLGWTHIVNSSQVNEFKASGQWYSAIFSQGNPAAALAAFPTALQLGDGSLTALGGAVPAASFIAEGEVFPQGRNVTQYQFVDDYSWARGKHTWKFGVNFHRNDVTDDDPQTFAQGLVTVNSLTDFFNGGNASNVLVPNPNFNPAQPQSQNNPQFVPAGAGNSLTQHFPTRLSQPIAVYGLGVYGQDEWAVNKKLKLTLALRVDHNSNPVCQTDCFARLATPFTQLNLTGATAANTPYNQFIQTGLHQAYPATDIVVWQPRLGFAYSPTSDNKTVIRGGIGIFSDSFPATVADALLNNPPTLASFTVVNAPGAVRADGTIGPATSNGIIAAPTTNGSVFTTASGLNNSFVNGFAAGGSATKLNLLAAPPGLTSTDAKVRQPRYYEWNLEIQRELPWNNVLSVNYVGNHGSFEAIQNTGLNGFSATGFANLPTAAPNPALGVVSQIQSIGSSNFDGLVATLRHSFTHGLLFQVNYQWSHSLDDVSNGGLLGFNGDTDASLLNPSNPFNVRSNYGNSDYDVRHYLSLNYVWDDSLRHLFHWGPNAVFGGWTVSGTLFARSGLPFSVIDQAASAALHGENFAGTFTAIATPTGANPFTGTSCGSAAATTSSCLNPAAFNTTGFINPGTRNSFRGPDYFNTDLSVLKYTNVYGEKAKVGLGLQFFNLLNHPNFDQPVNDVSNPNFGKIQRTVNTPTSILGSFLGGDASPRLIQLKAEVKF
jgi:hypothetical protein